MFCPKCGQQSSDEVRFCPKCGLQLRLVYSWLFNDNVLPVGKDARRRDLAAAGDRPAIGAPPFIPAASFGRQQQRVHTAEIVRPPSITENTTRLLDKDS